MDFREADVNAGSPPFEAIYIGDGTIASARCVHGCGHWRGGAGFVFFWGGAGVIWPAGRGAPR